MIHRFTPEARRVVMLAHAEVRRMGHHHLGSEHLLLGLIRQEWGAAARALGKPGVTYQTVEREVAARVRRSTEELGIADAEALRAVGIDLDEVRARMEAAFGPGALRPPMPRKRGLTPRAKRVLESSLRQAEGLGERSISSAHLILGLNATEESVGAQILRDLGVTAESVRAGVGEELRRAS